MLVHRPGHKHVQVQHQLLLAKQFPERLHANQFMCDQQWGLRQQQHLHVHRRQHSLVHVPVGVLELERCKLQHLFGLQCWHIRDNIANSDERSCLYSMSSGLLMQRGDTAAGVWVLVVILERRRVLVHAGHSRLLYDANECIGNNTNRAVNMPGRFLVQFRERDGLCRREISSSARSNVVSVLLELCHRTQYDRIVQSDCRHCLQRFAFSLHLSSNSTI